jgi:septal ring factor EnvC (AmiA/AmiB activator)
MKKFIANSLIVLTLASSSALLASVAEARQGMQHQPPSVEQRVERLSESLSLNAAQQASVTTIMQQLDEKMSALREQHGVPDRSAFHEDMRALHESTREALAQVLDADQLAKLDEMPKPHERRGGPMQGRPNQQGEPPLRQQ